MVALDEGENSTGKGRVSQQLLIVAVDEDANAERYTEKKEGVACENMPTEIGVRPVGRG
jgi:hypothetical protein